MDKDLLLGIDIGTQATKGVILDRAGQLIASAEAAYEVALPNPMWAEQAPSVWVDAVSMVSTQLLTTANVEPKRVAGLCISGLYGGSGIPLDSRMMPVRPCLIWMDRRATRQVEWIKDNLDLERLFEITGNWVDSYFGYTKICWIRDEEPDNWRRIRLFLPPSSYVVYRLTGTISTDHSSAGNLAGIYNIIAREWSAEAADLLGIPLSMMPETLELSEAIVGEIHNEGSAMTRLPVGTPVLAGGVDAPMATLAAGAFAPGDNVSMMGTSTCWGIVHRGDRYSRNLVSMPHVVEGRQSTYTWAGSATSGAIIKWFRDTLVEAKPEGTPSDAAGVLTLLDQAAASVKPGSEGLVVLPYFMGERAPVWDPGARGCVLGLTLAHTKIHLYRAFLEAVGYALRHAMEAGRSAGLQTSDEVVIVGGVARSSLWIHILADITGRRVKTLATEGIGAPLGDAFLVARALGWESEASEIRKWLKYNDPVLPDSANRKVYDRGYASFRQLYEVTRPILNPDGS